MKTIDPQCPACSASRFEVRVVKDEMIGAASCVSCGSHFLMLDSGDYWFDVIQNGYPRASRCGCKNTTFALRFDYRFRDDGDVETVDVWSTCTGCAKQQRRMTVEIDYGDTGSLVKVPLQACKTLKILYDLRQLNLFATREDMARIAHYLGTDLGLTFTCWLRKGEEWVRESVEAERIENLLIRDRYLAVFASRGPLVLPDPYTIRADDAYWKRNEVVRLSSPTDVGYGRVKGSGPLFYIKFSTEFVDGEKVHPKSPDFRATTDRLIQWLRQEFVTSRGPQCFDNPDEHMKHFGDRFKKP